MPKTTTTAKGAPVYPLTGLAVDDASRAARPALVVKIDNAPQAWPQAGIDQADITYEEVVEGGITRFLAVFQSHDAGTVGPVRSVRPIDPAIVTPLRGLFGYSGGAPKFKAMIARAPVQLVGFDEASDAYYRERGRTAPHNMMTSTAALWAKAKDGTPPPQILHYLATGETFGGPNEKPVQAFSVVLGQRTSAEWDWDGGAHLWRRVTNGRPHMLVTGQQLAVVNVILQLVDYRNTGDVDVGGNPVPEADIVGQGRAFFLAEGTLVPGRWSKPDAATPTQFTTELGAPVKLVPGRTWVEFMPSTAVTSSR